VNVTTEFEACRRGIVEALACLDLSTKEQLLPVLTQLLAIIYKNLRAATIGNPMVHHFKVLDHMIEITVQEGHSYPMIARGAATSLLHDVSAVAKITTEMVAEARKKSKQEGDALELRRQQNRILHMREGSAIAHRALLDLNEAAGRIVFDAQDIDEICEVIRIHDNPSIDIPIPRCNWLAMAFREADRLWMVTEDGIRVDLLRKNQSMDDAACLAQLDHNVNRFRDERALYTSPDEKFIDDETFFRTDSGHAIFSRLRDQASKKHSKRQ
jgi:hypothetical protein